MKQIHCLVSAIITTHNRKELLKRAVTSVLGQTYKNIELIVVDDSSTDGTNQYCLANSKIKYIFIPNEESKGGNYARNLGIEAAQGEYVAFLDDDDYWLPEKIEKQISLAENKLCNVVYCGQRLEIVSGNIVRYKDVLPYPQRNGDMHKQILMRFCTLSSCLFIKRTTLIEAGCFDENLKFWQDYELTIRLAQNNFFYFVNEPLTVYRVNAKDKNRLTNKYYGWKQAVKYIHKKHEKLYDNLNLLERFISNMLVLQDAVYRAKSSGLISKYLIFWIACAFWKVPLKLYYFIRYRLS